MTTSNEIAVREGTVVTAADRAVSATALTDRHSIHSWLVVMRDVTLLAEHICDTAFVPKAIRGNAPAVAAAILAGMELDLPPMTALRHVQIVEGSPGLSAEYKRARVLAAGHKLDITEHTTEACTVTGYRKGHEPVTVRYTIGDARRGGLVKDRGAYMTRPRRMLFARACTEVCDALFTDITNGLPTAELIEDDGDDYAPDGQQPQEPRPDAAAALRARKTVTAEVVTQNVPPAGAQTTAPAAAAPPAEPAGGTPDGDPGPLPGSPEYESWMKVAQAQAARVIGKGDQHRDERLAYAAVILRVNADAVTSFSDLTLDELKTVGDTLGKCKDRAALDALLATGETGGDPRDEDGEVTGE